MSEGTEVYLIGDQIVNFDLYCEAVGKQIGEASDSPAVPGPLVREVILALWRSEKIDQMLTLGVEYLAEQDEKK